MALRSIWTGSVTFGLVNIPIKLYAATQRQRISFRQLHADCGTPVRYRRWCPRCDVELEKDDISKGYEYDKNRYVIVQPEELEAIPVASAKRIEITDFVRSSAIDPIYFDRSYLLEPVGGGEKAYLLLRQAMMDTGQVALAKVTLRTKEHLACLRRYRRRALLLETLYYPSELRDPDQLSGLHVEEQTTERELELAVDLVEQLSAEYEPDRYRDEYRESVLELIDQKIKGEDVVTPVEEDQPQVLELMEALEASLSENQNGQEVSTPR